MKLTNKSGNGLSHFLNEKGYFLANGETKEIPNAVAEVWLKIKGVEEYADPEELKKVKAELEKVKKTAETTKKVTKKTTKKKSK